MIPSIPRNTRRSACHIRQAASLPAGPSPTHPKLGRPLLCALQRVPALPIPWYQCLFNARFPASFPCRTILLLLFFLILSNPCLTEMTCSWQYSVHDLSQHRFFVFPSPVHPPSLAKCRPPPPMSGNSRAQATSSAASPCSSVQLHGRHPVRLCMAATLCSSAWPPTALFHSAVQIHTFHTSASAPCNWHMGTGIDGQGIDGQSGRTDGRHRPPRWTWPALFRPVMAPFPAAIARSSVIRAISGQERSGDTHHDLCCDIKASSGA